MVSDRLTLFKEAELFPYFSTEAARSPITEPFSLQKTHALVSDPTELNRLPSDNLIGQDTHY